MPDSPNLTLKGLDTVAPSSMLIKYTAAPSGDGVSPATAKPVNAAKAAIVAIVFFMFSSNVGTTASFRRRHTANSTGAKTIRLVGKKDAETAVRDDLPACFPRLWRFCVSLTGQRDQADDLAQMTCLRAIEKANLFQPGTHLDRWLFVMARRIWFNELRSASIRKTASFSDDAHIYVDDEKPDAETNIFAREVFDKVNTLPEAQRGAALLVFVEGYKYSETAEILDVPIGTVMSRVAAARMTLRSQLEPTKEPGE
ncbi:MAG: RNA polymerase sigma factor [Pseudomonadota bacterium]